ncbi:oligopeptide transporter, OPT family [Roseiconus nitratireducens]|uniref:Oligopeptide transporter, OPT family n=1 Tax=Roseiconus nitratireducens TaxID=2605748 RepID=A0A5M6D6C9_9BACT|nr:oligopeptide transporter, OPT family [Roseiconus nitratireducens]KAA5543084.1 oligopeptide transporter, OPT family [Roseiconus nitratireducens]
MSDPQSENRHQPPKESVAEAFEPPAPVMGKELTPRVIVLGLLLSVVMGAANVYVGLKAGMTVSASIPAAVMAMLLFRLLFRNSTIREANQVQTCASAGESLAAGIIFTMPSMILIGYWQSFDFWTVSMVALTGGLLGILFMIPMRRVFVVGDEDLPFPEGVACAAVLEAGEESEGQQDAAISLVIGAVIGGTFKVLAGFLSLVQDTLQTARVVGDRIFYFGGDLSPMLVAVGFIVRLNVAVLIFIGGALGWLIGIPLRGGAENYDTPIDGAWEIWSTEIRYVGVGAMVVGGIASLVAVRGGLVTAVKELSGGLRGRGEIQDDLQRDIPSGWILILTVICTAMLATLNYRFTHDLGVTVLATAVMLAMGFFFTAVASYIVGLVGNSNSPVSGMTITAVLAAGGLLWLFNYSGTQGMVATLGIAAVVCCVACTSGDVCNDLKTGSLVGATPFRQQIMQIAGVAVASFVMAPVLTLLHNNTPGGIGGEQLSAPQASLFASLARGFAGEGHLPWDLIGWGAGIGVIIWIIDEVLKRRTRFRAHLMPIAVGMYLPFGLATPILIGGLIAHLYSRRTPRESRDRVLHRGVLFSSGVIAGEALTAVGLAGLAALGITSLDLGVGSTAVTLLSYLAVAGIITAFLVMTRPKT